MASHVKADSSRNKSNNTKGQNSTKRSNQPQSSSRKRPRKTFRARNIDRRLPHEKWMFKMAKRPLNDLLPRNSEIHNFTSMTLTERQSRILGMGLKFRPSLRPPGEAQFYSQIEDFCRRVRLQDKFANCPCTRQRSQPQIIRPSRLESSARKSRS